jgi:ectoine hydroxylase-related dioxygenase (phytanoyl-CoA dioxygenase family)
MLGKEQIDSFHRNGYLVVPDILSADQVRSLRAALRPKFNTPESERYPGDSEHYLFDIFSRYPDLRWLLLHEPTLAVLRSLLGEDFVVMREAAAHFQNFGGWHKDTTSQEVAGHMFQWDPDYLMIEVGYYLQDNTVEFGGGLDVQPGSHLQPDQYAHPAPPPSRMQKLVSRLTGNGNGSQPEVVSIPSKAGDLVLFHFRVDHRATPTKHEQIPEDQQKMAIFTACSRNTPHVKTYHDFISSRDSYVYLKGGFSYPEELVADCRTANINLV